MKALTLRHPWIYAVLHLGKRIENRTWVPSLECGEWFALHGGKPPQTDWELNAACALALDLCKAHPHRRPEPFFIGDCFPLGLVGVARFGGIVTRSDDAWFEGPNGWLLSDVRPLARPIPCRGAQGLWNVPPELVEEIRRQVPEAILEAQTDAR